LSDEREFPKSRGICTFEPALASPGCFFLEPLFLMNWTTTSLCLLLLSASACTKPEHREAKAFRNKLADEIRHASLVEVVEHSDMMDFPDHAFAKEGERSSDEVPKIEYARLRLSEDQKKNLLKRIQAFDEKDSPTVSFCGFVPHHTLEFHSPAGAVSSLEICFQCSTFHWSGGKLSGSPGKWVDEFESFIADVGLHADADWRDLVVKSGKVSPAR
jgi:hypothetical protein